MGTSERGRRRGSLTLTVGETLDDDVAVNEGVLELFRVMVPRGINDDPPPEGVLVEFTLAELPKDEEKSQK